MRSLGGKDGKVEAGKIRRNRVTLYMGFRHRLQPHTLPDARHRGVPDAGRIGNLLSTRLQVIIRAVQHPHFQGLFPTLQVRRNVKVESRIAAGMGAHVLAVEPYIGLPVHRPKMEEDFLLLPALGQLESGAVPEGFISPWVTSHSGEGRLRAERHQDAAFRLAFVPGRLVSLSVKPAFATALSARLPSALSGPWEASVTLLEATTPVKLPTKRCPTLVVRPRATEGWYFTNDSTIPGGTVSQSPTYPTHLSSKISAKL